MRRFLPTPTRFLWLMRLFPPLLVNGVWPTAVSDDFRQITVRIRKFRLNTNFSGAIWGGALLAAVDPWHGMLLFVLMNRNGLDCKVASTAVSAEFIKAAKTSLTMQLQVTPEQEQLAVDTIRRGERFEMDFPCEAVNAAGEVCFRAMVRIYLRRIDTPLRVVQI